jgi:acid phosphatase type 7
MTNRELVEKTGMRGRSKSESLSGKPCRYLLAMMFFCFFCIVPAITEASGDYWAPWVTKTTTNSATINWRGEDLGSGSVEYATSSYYSEHQSFEKTTASQLTGSYQHVSITGLEPNTSYIYRVRPSDNTDVFSNRTFRTLPVSGPFTFVVISDPQEGHHYTEEQRFKYVADAIAKEQDVLFILQGGDYARFDDESRWATFFQVADKMLAKSTIFPTIGNHEYHNIDNDTLITAGDQYREAFDVPLHYAFDCAGIRFISLNTPDPNHADGDDPQTSLALAESQVPWLREQLDNKMSGTFIIHHHPIWDDGRTTTNADLQPWEDLFQAYRISADFAGHTHNYQRFQVEGIPYFISGNAGGPFAVITDTKPIWYQFGATNQLGYLRVTVDPTHNSATAQEVFVASVNESDSSETPYVYDPPVVGDAVTFPLTSRPSWKLYLPLAWKAAENLMRARIQFR